MKFDVPTDLGARKKRFPVAKRWSFPRNWSSDDVWHERHFFPPFNLLTIFLAHLNFTPSGELIFWFNSDANRWPIIGWTGRRAPLTSLVARPPSSTAAPKRSDRARAKRRYWSSTQVDQDSLRTPALTWTTQPASFGVLIDIIFVVPSMCISNEVHSPSNRAIHLQLQTPRLLKLSDD